MFRTILFLLISVTSFSQKYKDCFDQSDRLVNEQESDYCVVGKKILRIDNLVDTIETYVDTVKAFYSVEKRIKFLRIYNRAGYLNGNFIEYYANGKIKQMGANRDGNKYGKVISNYPGGKVQHVLEYAGQGIVSPSKDVDFRIFKYNDINGKVIVNEGIGFCDCVLESGRREVGKVVDGLRDSVWLEYSSDTLILKETYAKGHLIKGVRFYNGSEYAYNDFYEEPTYKNGHDEMISMITKNLRYPAEARRMGVDGTVYVGFIINEDGSVGNTEIVKGVSSSVDKEAARVVTMLKNWEPKKVRGRPISSHFILPIRFKSN